MRQIGQPANIFGYVNLSLLNVDFNLSCRDTLQLWTCGQLAVYLVSFYSMRPCSLESQKLIKSTKYLRYTTALLCV